MDLRSILDEPSGQRPPPRLQTSHTAYDTRAVDNKPIHDPHLNRPASYGPPLQSHDSRSQQGPPHLAYSSSHQPHANSGSTHTSATSGSTHSGYAQSPVTHTQPYLPRENGGHAAFVPSPSMSIHQPPTPGSAHSYQGHTPVPVHAPAPGQHLSYNHSPSPRGSHALNGQVNPQTRTISPQAQYHHQSHQPATPLGPPISYNKISPQAQRPPSQGHEQSYRRGSHGSTGSVQGREYSQSQPPAELARSENLQPQRHSLPEADGRTRERESSLSVSPKTIPRPPPQRQTTSSSYTGPQRPPTHPHEMKQMSAPPPSIPERQPDMRQSTPVHHASPGQADQAPFNRGPAAQNSYQQTPIPTDSPSRSREQTVSTPGPALKRNASFMSDSPGAGQQPRKRPRRNDIPPWAQSTRKKPPKFGEGVRKARNDTANFTPQAQTHVPPAKAIPTPTPASAPILNGHATVKTEPVPTDTALQVQWEPTIANELPEDDLCRAISTWIYKHIGNQAPPQGAMFEIEAKIGEILDVREGRRLSLPVWSETIFRKEQFGNTKFESSMNMAQHQRLNKYLNDLATIAWNDDKRESVRPCHLREYDDFYELSEEGRRNLPPAQRADGRRQTPRVRVTTDKETGEVRAKIVKSRLADLEVYNPNYDFDFRISISLESPWDGPPTWLDPTKTANSRTRLKDRMSYRHTAIQVDLTQVSHDDSQQMEHELEVEVSMPMLQAELERNRMNVPNRYYDLVKSLIDNTRLLCRKGSLQRPPGQ